MDFHERMLLRPVLWSVMHERIGNAFETLFHDIMCLVDSDFADVRTHGRIGDQGSDGLSLHNRKLYACYAPETPNAKATVAKLRKDLTSACRQREAQFDSFVFVNNDSRGTHPEVATELVALKAEYPEVSFELIGYRKLLTLLGGCDIHDVEQVLGRQLPLLHVTNLGMQEMVELLESLATARITETEHAIPEPVSANKLSYSELTFETQTELRESMKYSEWIEDYYAARIDVTERDEVAASFNAVYRELSSRESDPEVVLLGLRTFLAGSRQAVAPQYRAQTAVLAYYFQSCDIFKNPPSGWQPSEVKAW